MSTEYNVPNGLAATPPTCQLPGDLLAGFLYGSVGSARRHQGRAERKGGEHYAHQGSRDQRMHHHFILRADGELFNEYYSLEISQYSRITAHWRYGYLGEKTFGDRGFNGHKSHWVRVESPTKAKQVLEGFVPDASLGGRCWNYDPGETRALTTSSQLAADLIILEKYPTT